VTAAQITAITAAGAVALGFVTAVLGFLNQRRIQRTAAAAEITAGKVREISVNVDGRLTGLFEQQAQLLARQAQLLGALHDSGTPIPPPIPPPSLATLIPSTPEPPVADVGGA
jgi:hypothetical protein